MSVKKIFAAILNKKDLLKHTAVPVFLDFLS
jgi:hypothetical protein